MSAPALPSLAEGIETPASSGGRQRSGGPRNRGGLIKLIVAGVALLAAGVIGFVILDRPASNSALTSTRSVMCSETGQVWEDFGVPDEPLPWTNPRTGRKTLWIPEKCFWTNDGRARSKNPTYVILNEDLGKDGPTTCPDCGRPVKRFNPLPPFDLIDRAIAEGR